MVESDIEFVETGPQVIEIPDANDSRWGYLFHTIYWKKILCVLASVELKYNM